MDRFATSIFSMKRGLFASRLILRHGWPWIAGAAMGSIGLGVYAGIAGDVRFAILALMVMLVVLPMAMPFLYFRYALHPDVAFNMLPHSLRITRDTLQIEIYPSPAEKEAEKTEKEAEETEKEAEEADKETEEATPPSSRIMQISLHRLGSYIVGKGEIFISLHSESGKGRGESGFIYLPMAAFSNSEEFQDFIKSLYRKDAEAEK